ncbi:hypothetical protein ACW6QP_15185 [Salegentibacter sp. HM20]
MNKLFILILVVLSSCGNEKNNMETNLDESNFIRTQGLITEIETHFNYTEKFKRTYHYVYGGVSKTKRDGTENTDLILNVGDPVIVMVNKTDQNETFIAHRGIIDKNILEELKATLP